MYGVLSEAQAKALVPYINGQRVLDLGCGDMENSHVLLEHGADHIVAVDKAIPGRARLIDPRITAIETYFHNLEPTERVVFASWVINHPTGIAKILDAADVVVYLGKNTDGSSCGSLAMWVGLIDREVLVHVPERRNTLIVYGPNRIKRSILPEEFAAIDSRREGSSILSYDVAVQACEGMR